MAKILVIRFSALGDVAMTIPVLVSFAEKYPQHQITFLSRESFAPLFKEGLPSNIVFKGVDLKNRYNGIKGLNALYNELAKEKFDYIADLHDVLRSKYLRFRFMISGKKTAHINKGRKDKRNLVKQNNKKFIQLKTSFERYREVFNKLGFDIPSECHTVYSQKTFDINTDSLPLKKDNDKWIGIAPFAAHKGKIYPLEKQEEVIRLLSEDSNIYIFLFGGGEYEKWILNKWEGIGNNIMSMAGKLSLDKEIKLMEKLDVMISMDSANMHLASLVSTPVISIWGATHPYAGFMGWNQPYSNAVQVDMPCRPCSIFGNKPCIRGNYKCLNDIKPETIINKIYSIISK